MEIEGKIILDLGMQQGTSKAGRDWKKKKWYWRPSAHTRKK